MLENFLITWLVTGISLFVVTKLPLGIESRDLGSTIVAALVIGLVNAFLGPIVWFLSFPLMILTLGLFSFVVNAFLFWLSSVVVKGFQINGCFSAFFGAIILSLLNMFFFWILPL
jgi:putative membrane protein